jgi:hypothetical protein
LLITGLVVASCVVGSACQRAATQSPPVQPQPTHSDDEREVRYELVPQPAVPTTPTTQAAPTTTATTAPTAPPTTALPGSTAAPKSMGGGPKNQTGGAIYGDGDQGNTGVIKGGGETPPPNDPK